MALHDDLQAVQTEATADVLAERLYLAAPALLAAAQALLDEAGDFVRPYDLVRISGATLLELRGAVIAAVIGPLCERCHARADTVRLHYDGTVRREWGSGAY
jgi:hypothetical protein